MLPARNAESFLPGYLDNVATFGDMVVALDDGSTDNTYDILASHPLVKVLLRNPQRENYWEWDDAANRNRLLTAANELQPEWLFSLDADERLDERDAQSLREFIQTDALPGFAYGFRHVSMRGDTEHFLPRYWWYYRLFGSGPGQRFPNQKLHFVPVPTNIPRFRWLKTSLRIQHLGELDEERRLERFGKYLEADPLRRFEDNYAEILNTPPTEELRRWLPRPQSIPVLLGKAVEELEGDQQFPAFSVIVLDQGDEAAIQRTLESLVHQQLPNGLEVILVTCVGSASEKRARESFPYTKLVSLSGRVSSGEAYNQGLLLATGRFVFCLDPEVELLPDSLREMLTAHELGYALVAGSVANGTQTPAGWASYFLEHAAALPGQPSAAIIEPLSNCSFAQLPLNEVGGFAEYDCADVERAAVQSILKRGYLIFRDAKVHSVHHGPGTIVDLAARQFQFGRRYGKDLVARHRKSGRLFSRENLASICQEIWPGRLQRIEAGVMRSDDDTRSMYRRCRLLVTFGVMASAVGTLAEVIKPERGKAEILWGRPFLTVLVCGQNGVVLVRWNSSSRTANVRPLPPHLLGFADSYLAILANINSLEMNGEIGSLSFLRDVAARALDLEDLECIVDPCLSWSESPENDKYAAAPTEPVCRVKPRIILGVNCQSIRSVRSTLGPWTTRRVLKSCTREMP